MNHSFIVVLLLTLLHAVSGHASAQTLETLKLAENKRIETSICGDSMNRIAVTNDRITHIFGDEGTFESQNDEVTGQIFLKPTAENGSKNLSITLITEQGVTQDLTLTPTASSARTLILTHDGAHQAIKAYDDEEKGKGFFKETYKHQDFASFSSYSQPSSHQLTPWPTQLLDLFKKAMNGHLPVREENSAIPRSSSPEGCAVTPLQSWQVGSYGIYAFTVENLTDTPITLSEKDFYQSGDLALSFHAKNSNTQKALSPTSQPQTLLPQQETTLYVVQLRANSSEGMEGRMGEP